MTMRQGRDRNDNATGDLLSWSPPAIIERYDERRLKKATLRASVAHAVSETLTASELSREEIALAMSKFLGEDVSKNMLDAYASEAREEHTISYLRLLALIHATGDVRPLQIGAETFGHLVVDNKYLAFIELGMEFEYDQRVERLHEESQKCLKTRLREIQARASS